MLTLSDGLCSIPGQRILVIAAFRMIMRRLPFSPDHAFFRRHTHVLPYLCSIVHTYVPILGTLYHDTMTDRSIDLACQLGRYLIEASRPIARDQARVSPDPNKSEGALPPRAT